MKQKDAVFAAFTTGTENNLTGKELSNFAVEQVKTGLSDGTIDYSKDRNDEGLVKSYAKQLVDNWFKKDIRISGTKYVPATKRGPQVKDDTLKSLVAAVKSLRVNSPDNTDLIERVEHQIEVRKAEIAHSKATSTVQSLDETLAALEALGITA